MMYSDRVVDTEEEAGETVDYYFLIEHWTGYGVCHLSKLALSHTNQEGGRTMHTRIMVDNPF